MLELNLLLDYSLSPLLLCPLLLRLRLQLRSSLNSCGLLHIRSRICEGLG